MSSTEVENELTKEQYLELLEASDPTASPINKVRHRFIIDGQPFEVDVYPQWQNTAIMETELENREKKVEIPPFIDVIREVTGDKAYSNAGMARSFPKEDEI
jgi:CYTH domain-containing protein